MYMYTRLLMQLMLRRLFTKYFPLKHIHVEAMQAKAILCSSDVSSLVASVGHWPIDAYNVRTVYARLVVCPTSLVSFTVVVYTRTELQLPVFMKTRT